MSKRDLDALFRGAAAFRAGLPADGAAGPLVCGGFGGFGGVPPGLIEAMAGGGFDVIQHGPDEFEFVAKDAGEVVPPAA